LVPAALLQRLVYLIQAVFFLELLEVLQHLLLYLRQDLLQLRYRALCLYLQLAQLLVLLLLRRPQGLLPGLHLLVLPLLPVLWPVLPLGLLLALSLEPRVQQPPLELQVPLPLDLFKVPAALPVVFHLRLVPQLRSPVIRPSSHRADIRAQAHQLQLVLREVVPL